MRVGKLLDVLYWAFLVGGGGTGSYNSPRSEGNKATTRPSRKYLKLPKSLRLIPETYLPDALSLKGPSSSYLLPRAPAVTDNLMQRDVVD